MATVSASPSALRHYAESLGVVDSTLPDRAAELRRVLQRYRVRCPDLGVDHSWLADQLEAVASAAMAVNRSVHLVAAAFEQVDALPSWAHGPMGLVDGGEVRQLPAAVFVGAHRQVASAWERVDYLGELVVDLDPGTWRELVWGRGRRPSHRGDYLGGGGVHGRDGRVYPLVIPELEVDGESAHLSYGAEPTHDPATLGGADPGWVQVDETIGIARVNPYEPGALARVAVFAGMTAGLSASGQRWASPEDLATVTFTPQGRPVIAEMPDPLPHDPRVTAHTSGPARTRRGRRSGALDLVTGGLDGALHSSELHHPGVNVYRVLFEEHEDGGRRRARMHTYQLAVTEVGSAFVPSMGYAEGGTLRRKLVTPAPARGREMSQRPTTSTAGPGRGGSRVGPTTRSTRRLAGRGRSR